MARKQNTKLQTKRKDSGKKPAAQCEGRHPKR